MLGCRVLYSSGFLCVSSHYLIPPKVSSGWGIDLDYCDIEWFALEMNRDHPVIFEIAPKHFRSFPDYDGYCISSKIFFPTVVDIMVI